MKELIHKTIYKISYAIADKAFVYRLGQTIKRDGQDTTICSIIRDEESFQEWGSIVYMINVKDTDGNEHLFEAIENIGVSVGFSVED